MRDSTATLGATDIVVSRLAWGMWRFDGDDLSHARTLVDAAFDAGINLFDTADIYGYNGRDGFGNAERLLGRLFAADPGLRRRMVLASKGGIVPGVPYDSSAGYLVGACEASLRRLGTDHLDLFQVHRPDVLAHPAEVAKALETLVASGKVRAVGVSNYTPAQTATLVAHLQRPLASIQPEFSPLVIEPLVDGTLDLAMQHGMSVLAWSPLAGGVLVRRVMTGLHSVSVPNSTHGRRALACRAPLRLIRGSWRTRPASCRSSAASRPAASARLPLRTGSSGPAPTGTGYSSLRAELDCPEAGQRGR
jgi:aryl-alcohol dehydrogenase-like predicted oxidoreductase